MYDSTIKKVKVDYGPSFLRQRRQCQSEQLLVMNFVWFMSYHKRKMLMKKFYKEFIYALVFLKN